MRSDGVAADALGDGAVGGGQGADRKHALHAHQPQRRLHVLVNRVADQGGSAHAGVSSGAVGLEHQVVVERDGAFGGQSGQQAFPPPGETGEVVKADSADDHDRVSLRHCPVQTDGVASGGVSEFRQLAGVLGIVHEDLRPGERLSRHQPPNLIRCGWTVDSCCYDYPYIIEY